MERAMRRKRYSFILLLAVVCAAGTSQALAQSRANTAAEFGPVVSTYLGYLKNEQEVVDDRASRHEVTRAYYIRNSNRIRALRQVAIRMARENGNDYLPELEVAANDEFGNLFESPPKASTLRVGEVYRNTFRFLGTVRSGDTFYVFARLDPYEQAELMEKEKSASSAEGVQVSLPAASVTDQSTIRPRRAGAP
jgi:hypothetical protein